MEKRNSPKKKKRQTNNLKLKKKMIQGKNKKTKMEQILCGVKIHAIVLKNLKNTK